MKIATGKQFGVGGADAFAVSTAACNRLDACDVSPRILRSTLVNTVDPKLVAAAMNSEGALHSLAS